MTGGLSVYTPEIAERILRELRTGRSLRAVCRDEGMPRTGTVLHWVSNDREGFAARYRRARQIGGHEITGRPTLYTAEIAQRILDGVSDGRTLAEICAAPGMPSSSVVRRWSLHDRKGFADRYRRARQIGDVRARRIYPADVAERILDGLVDGRSLDDVCRDPGMPVPGTVRWWATQDRDGFTEHYKTARGLGYDTILDRIFDIGADSRGDWIVRRNPEGGTEYVVDHENIRRSRLRAEALRRLLSKMLPRNRPGLRARQKISDAPAAQTKQIERKRGQPSRCHFKKKPETG
jgi:hypothetical protein